MKPGAWLIGILALLLAANQGAAAQKNIFDDDWTPPKPSETAKPPESHKPAPAIPIESAKPPTPATNNPATNIPNTIATPPSLAPVAKRAIPTREQQTASRKVLKEVFADQLIDRSPAARKKLTEALLAMADKSADAPADQFVLCAAAIDAGAEAMQLPLAFKAADQMAKGFEVDALVLKADIAGKLSPRPGTELSEENAKAALAVVDQLSDADDFAAASRVCTALAPLTARNPALRTELQKRQRDLTEKHEAAEKFAQAGEKLKASPEDPAANLEVGRYRCFYKSDWKGLAALARGNDTALKMLAQRELAGANSVEVQVAIADAWWDLAETSPPATKAAIEWHAAEWYAKAAPALKGLSRAKADRRIEASGYVRPSGGQSAVAEIKPIETAVPTVPNPTPGQWRSLFDGKSLTGWDGDNQIWSVVDGAIHGKSSAKGKEISNLVSPGVFGDFVFDADFKLLAGNSGIIFRSQLTADFRFRSGYEADIYAPNAIGKLAFNDAIVSRPDIKIQDQTYKPGEWNHYTIEAAGEHIRLWVNGVLLTDTRHTGADSGKIALQTYGPTDVYFREIRIRQLTPIKPAESQANSKPPTAPADPAKKLTPRETTKHSITEDERLASKAADSAEVEVDGKWDKLDEGVALTLNPGDSTAGEVPASLRGRPFIRFRDGLGKMSFKVVKDGVVLLACTDRWGKGGNSGGNWKHELTTRAQLEQQGWSEVAIIPIVPNGGQKLRWIVFKRNCKAGESFTYRTEKYNAPFLIQ